MAGQQGKQPSKNKPKPSTPKDKRLPGNGGKTPGPKPKDDPKGKGKAKPKAKPKGK